MFATVGLCVDGSNSEFMSRTMVYNYTNVCKSAHFLYFPATIYLTFKK